MRSQKPDFGGQGSKVKVAADQQNVIFALVDRISQELLEGIPSEWALMFIKVQG